MSQKNPDWYKLIKVFKAAEGPFKISTGLTIPFLFGAYQTLEKPLANIDELIRTVLNSDLDKYPIIQRCPDIGKHVIMVDDKAKCNKEFSKFPKIESIVSKNILLISTNTNIGKTLDRVIHNLKLEYEGPISDQEFSWSKSIQSWRKFQEKEIELIKSIK